MIEVGGKKRIRTKSLPEFFFLKHWMDQHDSGAFQHAIIYFVD